MGKSAYDEKALQNAILQYIKYQPSKGFAFPVYNGGIYDPIRGHYRKPGKHHRRGVSDIIGIWVGRPLFCETKIPGNKLSQDQEFFLKQARRYGAIAFACWSFDQAMKELNRYDWPKTTSVGQSSDILLPYANCISKEPED